MTPKATSEAAKKAAERIEVRDLEGGNTPAQNAATIQSAIDEETKTWRAVVAADCETDANIRNLVRPIIGKFKTDGDNYGVPGLEDIVESLIAHFCDSPQVFIKNK